MRSPVAAAPRVSVVVLTKDEGSNLPALIESLSGLDAELFVVDSGSTDRTLEIVKGAGGTVVQHDFETHPLQWAWALSNLPLRAPWVLALDADHRLTPTLRASVAEVVARDPGAEPAGYEMRRLYRFRGSWIRHGGYHRPMLKLFPRGGATVDRDEPVDHHFRVEGRVDLLRGDLIEDNAKDHDMRVFVEKCAGYAMRQARAEHEARRGRATPRGSRAWNALPLYLRAIMYFVYRYVVRGGFLDGRDGFVFHFLQALWYRVLVDAQIDALRRQERERA